MRANHYLSHKKKYKKKRSLKLQRGKYRAGSVKSSNNRFYKEIEELNFNLKNLTYLRKQYEDELVLILSAQEQLDIIIKDFFRDFIFLQRKEILKKYNGKIPTLEELSQDNENLKKKLNKYKNDLSNLQFQKSMVDLALNELTGEINEVKDKIKYYDDHMELVVL